MRNSGANPGTVRRLVENERHRQERGRGDRRQVQRAHRRRRDEHGPRHHRHRQREEAGHELLFVGLRRHQREPDAGQEQAAAVENSERAQRPGPRARDGPQHAHHRRRQEVQDVRLRHERRQDPEAAAREEHAVDDREEAEREQEHRLAEQREPRLHERRAGPGVEPGADEHPDVRRRGSIEHGAHYKVCGPRSEPGQLRGEFGPERNCGQASRPSTFRGRGSTNGVPHADEIGSISPLGTSS